MNEDKPAFPVKLNATVNTGIARRDHIAIVAMQALCTGCGDSMSVEEIAARAYSMADAMIEESKK
jgi:hypothetical protein